jgi:hypothetical protein
VLLAPAGLFDEVWTFVTGTVLVESIEGTSVNSPFAKGITVA